MACTGYFTFTAHVIGAVLDTLTVHTGDKVLLMRHLLSMIEMSETSTQI